MEEIVQMGARKIIYLSYDGMTDPLGQSQVLPYLAGLCNKGYCIYLVSCEKKAAYAANGELVRQTCRDAGIEWRPVRYTRRPPVLSTLFDLVQMWRKADHIHKKYGVQLVHCRSYIAALAGLLMKRKYRIRFLFDMRGLWADERVDGHLWDLDNPLYGLIYRFFKRRERDFLEQADHTVCLTRAGKREIRSWTHIRNNPVPITVIPCCADLEHFDPVRISPEVKAGLKREMGISESDFIISYSGSLSTWYMPDEMLDFFKVFLQYVPAARFLFITRDRPDAILKKALKKDIDPFRIIVRSGSRQDMPALLSLSRCSLFFIKPAYSKMASSPTKQGEIMRLGIPLICNDGIGDTSGIVKACKAGVLVETFGPESYHKAAGLFLSATFEPEHIIAGAFEFFNLAKAIAEYECIYENLFSA